jgi:hypothetical protein
VDAIDVEVDALLEQMVERGLASPYPTPSVVSEFKA